MSKNIFEKFPYLVTNDIMIRKMIPDDVEALYEICNNENVYRHTPDFLYKKSITTLKTAIENLGERDFIKKKWIIAGICLPSNPDKVIGIAEIFNYGEKVNMVEIGYLINESFWKQGIATKVIEAMVNYLFDEIGINRIQATVMPQNMYSSKALLKNGFIKEGLIRQANYWNGKGVIDLEMYSILQSDVKL